MKRRLLYAALAALILVSSAPLVSCDGYGDYIYPYGQGNGNNEEGEASGESQGGDQSGQEQGGGTAL